MYSLTIVAALIGAACAALISTSTVEQQLLKYDMLVDIMQSRVAAECPKEAWQRKQVKRAAPVKSAITEPEIQLENVKSLYSHYLSVLSKCKADAAKAAALKQRERAKAAALKAKAEAEAKARPTSTSTVPPTVRTTQA